MKVWKERVGLFLPLIGLLLATGCGGGAKQVSQPEGTQSQKPAWIDKGNGAFAGEMGEAFYGVGSSWGIQNPSLLRSSADNRARTEVARVFKTYTSALMEDYQASTMAGNLSRSLTGRARIQPAIDRVNTMGPEELYAHLRENLPYAETRDHIKKVHERMRLYQEWE